MALQYSMKLLDDIYIPGKRGKGIHFHGAACTLIYGAFIFGAANFISVIVDHYDKRNNETNYQKFAKVTRIIGLILLFSGMIFGLFKLSW